MTKRIKLLQFIKKNRNTHMRGEISLKEERKKNN